MKSSHILAGLLVVLMTLVFGCPRNDVQVLPADDEPASATIQGRLEVAPEQLQGANLAVYEINAEGQLLARTVGTPQTDERGHYSVEFELPREPALNLIVEAQRDGQALARALIVEAVDAGDTITAAPMNPETTLEANVFVQAVSAGDWDARCTTPHLRFLIDRETASALQPGEDYQANVELLARATTAHMKAVASTLMHEEVGISQETFNSAMSNLQDVQVNHDERLHGATEMDEVMEAHREYNEEWLNAWIEPAINTHQLATAMQAGLHAQHAYLPELGDAAQNAALAHAELIRAQVVTHSINERFQELDADSERQEAIEQAGLTLRTTLEAMRPAEEDAHQRLRQAWTNYEQTVETHLQQTLEQEQQGALSNIRNNVRAQRAPVFERIGEVSSDAQSNEAANATGQGVSNFFMQTFSEGNYSTLQGVDISEDNAEAILGILFNLSLATDAGIEQEVQQ